MRYADIIAQSWELTTSNTKLKWLIFVPSFVAVFVFVLEVCWQLYLYLGEFGVIDKALSINDITAIIDFLVENNLLGWVIFGIVFVLLFTFVLSSWIEGALVLGVRSKIKNPEERLSIRKVILESTAYFFKLFEFNALQSTFSFWSFILFTATFYRYFHDSLFQVLWPFLVFYLLISLFITVFFSFAPYFIVLEEAPVGKAIKQSIGMVFLNFGQTMAIIGLMILVNFRILVNVLVVLGVPLGILFAFSYFASTWILVLAVIVGLILLGLAAYLTAIVEVFSRTVWVRSFQMLKPAMEDTKGLEHATTQD